MKHVLNAWYVAAWGHDVIDQLFARRICDIAVLIFRQQDGTAVALEDRCPHRFAPLHMGRRVGDNIECGYHGLQFNGAGQCVSNPHGNHVVPKACTVRAFALVERYGALWIWMGEQSLADPAQIPDFSHLGAPGTRTVHGGKHIKANFELIADNLMDASHTQFVHMDQLGSDGFARARHEVLQEGRVVHSNYHLPGGAVPAAYSDYFPADIGPVNYSVHFTWYPPGVVRNRVVIEPIGNASARAIERIGTHLLTPETLTTTHYLFCHTRNFDTEDLRVDSKTRRWQQKGLVEQDGPMIEAVQANMGSEDLSELHPALFSVDSAAVRVRRVMSELRAGAV